MRHKLAHATITAGWMCIVGMIALPAPADAQGPPPSRLDPPPQGQRIEARDGDVVVIEDDARVQLVNRKQGFARTVYDAERRWLVLVLDANSRTVAAGRQGGLVVSLGRRRRRMAARRTLGRQRRGRPVSPRRHRSREHGHRRRGRRIHDQFSVPCKGGIASRDARHQAQERRRLDGVGADVRRRRAADAQGAGA